MGTKQRNMADAMPKISDTHVISPHEFKSTMMLSEAELLCYEPEAMDSFLEQREVQHVGMPVAELESMPNWFDRGEMHASKVIVPTMFKMGDTDWLFHISPGIMEGYRAQFKAAERFDWSIIQGGPHALEWSSMAYGYYLRCFGWACEVTSARDRQLKPSKTIRSNDHALQAQTGQSD